MEQYIVGCFPEQVYVLLFYVTHVHVGLLWNLLWTDGVFATHKIIENN